MSELRNSDRYKELYIKYKSIVDKADNPIMAVTYYLDKKHRSKVNVDIDNAIYIDKGIHKFRLIGGI
jgi:hypothetical protein